MPSTAATHPAKRQYAGTHSHAQQSITSYFSAAAAPCSATNPSYIAAQSSSASQSPLSPPLPDHVQSNLLSVGMRIRKSVPEGYKTGDYSAFGLFSDSPSSVPVKPQAQATSQRTYPRTSYRRAELTPFCGILKVGGFATQSFDADDVPDVDDVSFFSSQGSTITNASVDKLELGAGKRRFDDEEEEPEIDVLDEGDFKGFGIWRDEEVSPKSRPLRKQVGDSRLGLGVRPMAVPRTRRKGASGIEKDGMIFGGQENTMVDFDFGDADFLDYEAWKSDEMEL